MSRPEGTVVRQKERRWIVTRRARALLWVLPLLFVSVSFCVYLAALAGADRLLSVRDPVAKADIIVVLGGDGPPRAARAAALWNEGVAPRVLVSGDGDCNYIRRAMIERGVDGDAIEVECLSRNTRENAAFSGPILKRHNVREAVLVTSWFHSRRALATFAASSSDIRWMSVPAEPPTSSLALAFDSLGIQIFKEYIKLPWYDLSSFVLALMDQTTAAREGS